MIKVELHCHLDGSLDPVSVQEMLAGQGIHYDLEELKEKLAVRSECTSLTEYLEKFDLPLMCLQDKKGIIRAAYEVVRDAAKENVKYIEVRFAPMLHTNKGLSCKEAIECVVEGLQKGQEEFDVYASAIVCAMRHHSLEMNMEMLQCAKEFFEKGVCAIDLAGDESAFPTELFRPLFIEAAECKMPFTIHSGECGNVENVRVAVELGAKRMGHGIALAKDKELQKICAEKRIGIEMCPTSNLQTKAVENLEDYPLKEFLEQGIPASIHTDNRTVSGTTLEKEFALAKNELGLNDEELRQCTRNAIETAFAGEDIKNILRAML